MAEDLRIYGHDFDGVEGFKVTDQNGNVLIYANSGVYTITDFTDMSKPVGAIVDTRKYSTYSSEGAWYRGRTALTDISWPNATHIPDSTFSGCGLTSISAPNVTTTMNNAFQNAYNLEYIVLPKCNYINPRIAQGCSKLKGVDLGGETSSGNTAIYNGNHFNGCTNLKALVLRSSVLWGLGGINSFTSSPFTQNGSGGTLYVPSSLISSYQSATNWSTILGYTNNQIKSIESTHTDPNAPVDLTLYYIDGTPIPTT